MAYLNAITFLFNRLNLKHQEKGESFRTCYTHEELDGLITGEYLEWNDLGECATIKDELNELADIAITCLLKIEVLLSEAVLPSEDPSPF